MKLIVKPFSIIGWVVLGIIENAFTTHFVLPKLTLVIGSILKKKLTFSVFMPIQSGPFISSSIFIVFNSINKLSLLFFHHDFLRLNLSFSFNIALSYLSFKVFSLIIIIFKLIDWLSCWFGFCFEVFNWIKNGLSLRVHKSIFRWLIKGSMLEFVYILEILTNHLQQLGISIETVLVVCWILRSHWNQHLGTLVNWLFEVTMRGSMRNNLKWFLDGSSWFLTRRLVLVIHLIVVGESFTKRLSLLWKLTIFLCHHGSFSSALVSLLKIILLRFF